MELPRGEIEHIAKLIAFWHGQKIVVVGRDGAKTYAATRGYDSGWAWETDRFMNNHWQEYMSAAEQVAEYLGKKAKSSGQIDDTKPQEE